MAVFLEWRFAKEDVGHWAESSVGMVRFSRGWNPDALVMIWLAHCIIRSDLNYVFVDASTTDNPEPFVTSLISLI